MITLGSIVTAIKDIAATDQGTEKILLNLETGLYYGLDPVGACIWRYIQESRSVKAIQDHLLEVYEVEPPRCEAKTIELLEDLHKEGLILLEPGDLDHGG